LPALELELHPPSIVPAALLAWLLAVVLEIWVIDAWVWRLLTVVALLLWLTAFGNLLPGICSGAVQRITWTGEGTWRLCDGYGWEWSAQLVRGSQQWGPVTVLVWRTGAGRWWAVVTPATVGMRQYRRLTVRWRLQRHA
jgi:hypothetical protein